jgi:hypothetical protein
MQMIMHNVKMMGWGTALMISAAFIGSAAIAQGVVEQSAAPASVMPAPAGQLTTGQVTPVKASPEEQAEFRKKRDEQLLIALDKTFQHQSRIADPGVKPEEVGSLVLTMWEHLLIEEWRQTNNIATRAPDPGEVKSGPTGLRELSLGGIIFRNREDWTVWLNGQRLKPDALPREVMDINVAKKFVELKWYDAQSNLIYPIRLRPHQRFNLDSKIFLPGTPASDAPAK